MALFRPPALQTLSICQAESEGLLQGNTSPHLGASSPAGLFIPSTRSDHISISS